MTEIRYHPLVDCDSEGMEKIPMFATFDEATVRQTHGMYLTEIVPKYYRLHSVKGVSAKAAEAYVIHCPVCGRKLLRISSVMDEHNLALYRCQNCNK